MAQRQDAPRHGGAEDDFGEWFDSWDLDSRDEPRHRASHRERGSHAVGSAGSSQADGRLVAFAQDYGWRAYAIPVLAVITVFVLLLSLIHI